MGSFTPMRPLTEEELALAKSLSEATMLSTTDVYSRGLMDIFAEALMLPPSLCGPPVFNPQLGGSFEVVPDGCDTPDDCDEPIIRE